MASHLQHHPPQGVAVFAVRFAHTTGTEEHVRRFRSEASARSFYTRLARSMHPAEVLPVRWVELSCRTGVDPRQVLETAGDVPEGGGR